MGLGAGIVLLVVGLVIVTGAVDLPSDVAGVDVTTAGWICVVVGALGLVLFATTGRRRTRIEERHDV